ncbi:hypothetical protein DD922_15215, partial [Staphylococcus pseudintermedius]
PHISILNLKWTKYSTQKDIIEQVYIVYPKIFGIYFISNLCTIISSTKKQSTIIRWIMINISTN